MKSNTLPIQPDTFYHVYNRGINGENIFKLAENYLYFLNKYSQYIPIVANTYAYCLLRNHFHLLIKTRSEDEIRKSFAWKEQVTSSTIISTQFSHFFNGYSQAINKSSARTGSLLETPFRRKEVTEESYLRRLVFYIHFNSQKHNLCRDFKKYLYSSYLSFTSDKNSKLQRDEVLEWFGGTGAFISFHDDLSNLSDLVLD